MSSGRFGTYSTPRIEPSPETQAAFVFDCGSSYQGASLNKQILQGFDGLSSLIRVIPGFHNNPVAKADLEVLFHQENHRRRLLINCDSNISFALVESRRVTHLFGATSCAGVSQPERDLSRGRFRLTAVERSWDSCHKRRSQIQGNDRDLEKGFAPLRGNIGTSAVSRI